MHYTWIRPKILACGAQIHVFRWLIKGKHKMFTTTKICIIFTILKIFFESIWYDYPFGQNASCIFIFQNCLRKWWYNSNTAFWHFQKLDIIFLSVILAKNGATNAGYAKSPSIPVQKGWHFWISFLKSGWIWLSYFIIIFRFCSSISNSFLFLFFKHSVNKLLLWIHTVFILFKFPNRMSEVN